MKREPKKITLHRETLLPLDQERLEEAAGGITLTCLRTCNSNNTCATRLC